MLRKEQVENAPGAAQSSKPIYPGLAVFPIACLLGAFLSDLAYLSLGLEVAAQVSVWLIGCALAGGGLLALFRLTDYFTIRRVQPQDNGLLLALGNVLALGLMIVSLVLRLDHAEAALRQGTLLLSIAIAGLLLAIDTLASRAKLRPVLNRNNQ